MTYKQIEASREVRLWIGQVLVPATIGAAALMANPETRWAVTQKVNEVKRAVVRKFSKKEKES